MAQKLKLMTILGTRPEIIRLCCVMKCADKYLNHVIVHTGQNWDHALNQVFFEDLNLRAPDHCLDCVGAHLGQTIGNIIARSYEVMQKEQPDAVLILGDTNSALSAISAKRLKIPIFHMEAGNRCWDFNVSEMINRKIVDHIADVNLPYTEHSRRYLISEGIDGKTVFVTGSPMREVLDTCKDKIEKSDVLTRLSLAPGKYILVSAHREENIDIESNFMALMNAVNHIAQTYQMPVIYSTHPRSMKFIAQRGFVFHPLVKNMTPFCFSDYNKLQTESFCVLSDSGTLCEESALLHFAGVLIRTSTERPEVLDKGTVVIGGIKAGDIEQAIALATAMRDEPAAMPEDYADANVSIKVVKLIQSYTHIVNKAIWLKP